MATLAEGDEERRTGRDRDWTDAEAEGVPDRESQPPGIDGATASDGMVPPADHPLGSTEWGVTALEESVPEDPAARSRRERPDVPQAPPESPAGRLASGAIDPGDDLAEGEWVPDGTALSAEEEAVHIEEAP